MAENSKTTGTSKGDPLSSERSEQKKYNSNSVTEFAELIGLMSRFLTGLAGMPVFKAAGLGLADWLALMALSEADGIGNKQLAKRLGVSGQRANQITSNLTQGELVSITLAAEDARRVELRLTPTGKIRLDMINRELGPLLAVILHRHERALVKLLKGIKHTMKVVSVPNSETNPSAVAWGSHRHGLHSVPKTPS